MQLPAGDPLKQQVQSLSQQPGMAWLNDLSQRKDVNWQEIKLAKDKWDYSQEGLTQTGAIMIAIAIAIAVTIATQGTGTSLVGTTSEGAVAGSSTTAAGGTTLATTTGGVTTYTAEGTALNAGYTALMSQAAVTLANNKGDIGKTMQDMGKSDNIKSIVTSAVTAGALQSVNPDWMKQLSSTGQFTDKAVINLTNAAVSATIKTAIQGGSYEDNLTASLKTAGVDTVAGWAASNVGQGYKNGDGALSDLQGQYIAHKVAHALVGCASAAAKDSSCAAGALGGAVGEAFAEMYGQNQYGTADGATLTNTQQQEVLNMSKLVTAAVAGMTGKDAQAAVDAAVVAVVNNFLIHYKLKGMSAAYVDDQFASKLEKWIQAAKAQGVDITFNEAFRTTDSQAGLANNPNAITPAPAGSSLHEAGFAVDVNFKSLKDIPGGLTGDQQRKIILDAANDAGLSWGGTFSKKPDYPHFYYDPGGRTQKIVDAQKAYCEISGRCK